ncbi:MAG: radical SAM protein [Oligoflexales bacterium]|nr:radical SAM protein [Oligoflexales bacterium]
MRNRRIYEFSKNGAFIDKNIFAATARPNVCSFFLTNRCNAHCKYCNIPNRNKDEIDTSRALSIIDELAALGTVRVGLYGGEALLRKDLSLIIERAKSYGMIVHVYSNGFLVPKYIDLLSRTDGVFLSLDGPQEIHDEFRGVGSYEKVIKAIDVLEGKVPIYINAVITKKNVNQIKFLSRFAEEKKCLLNMQIVSQISELSSDVSDWKLNDSELKEVARQIRDEKKKNRYIAMSNTFLNRIVHRKEENYHKKGYQMGIVRCWNGRASCQIDANGNLHSCLHILDKEKALNLRSTSVKEAFHFLQACQCKTCDVACSVEYNLWLSLNFEAIFNVVKMYLGSKKIQKTSYSSSVREE